MELYDDQARRRDQARFALRVLLMVGILAGCIWLGWFSPPARNAAPPVVEVVR